MTLVFNPAAFKYGVTEMDVEAAISAQVNGTRLLCLF
jgi:hypothetical protein